MASIKNPGLINPPRQMIFFDCESLPEKVDSVTGDEIHKLRLWVACYVCTQPGRTPKKIFASGKTSYEFWSFIQKITNLRSDVYLFAHNAMFDLRLVDLWGMVDCGLLKLKKVKISNRNSRKEEPFIVIEEPPVILKLYLNGFTKLMILDTLNFFPMGCDALGKSIGLAKLKMPNFDEPDSKWFKYCQRDVDIIRKAVMQLIRFLQLHGPIQWKFTAAGLAQSMLSLKYDCGWESSEPKSDARSFERKSLFHGLINVYRKNQVIHETVYHLDVTSLYPSQMINPVPVELIDVGSGITPIEIDGRGVDSIVAEVLVETTIEPFGYRGEENRNHYRLGKYWTILTGPELRRALQSENVIEIGHYHQYRMQPIYRDFVLEIFADRKGYIDKKDMAFDFFCKLLLNSSYGKPAQQTPIWRAVPPDEEIRKDKPWGNDFTHDLVNERLIHTRYIDGAAYRNYGREEMDGTLPVITAWIAAAARERMRELRVIAGHSNVYYQAVDALFVNQNGFDALNKAGEIQDKELGKLYEKESADRSIFYGINHYEHGDNIVIAGLPLKIKRLPGQTEYEEEVFPKASHYLDNHTDDTIPLYRKRKLVVRNQKDAGNFGLRSARNRKTT